MSLFGQTLQSVIRRASFFLGCVITLSLSTTASAQESDRDGLCLEEWIALAPPINGEVTSAILFDDGSGLSLFVGGSFTSAGDTSVMNIARWDGAIWHDVGGGLAVCVGNFCDEPMVETLAIYDDGTGPALYAGGRFTQSATGLAPLRVAKWDGELWTALQGGVFGAPATVVTDLEVFDDGNGPCLYASGLFENAGTVEASNIAKWDGNAWSPLGLGTGPGAWVMTPLAINGSTYLAVAGSMNEAGGMFVRNAALWDGSEWSALTALPDQSLIGSVYALQAVDEGDEQVLYAGGRFNLGETDNVNAAKWDGSSWTPLGETPFGWVYSLAAYEFGGRTRIFGGGFFSFDTQSPVPRVAEWDGTQWTLLGSGVQTIDVRVNSIAPLTIGEDTILVTTGRFASMNGFSSPNLAGYILCPAEPCFEDVTGDGVVDLADLNLVLAGFGGDAPDGDANEDGVVDMADLNAVLSGFGKDCP